MRWKSELNPAAAVPCTDSGGSVASKSPHRLTFKLEEAGSITGVDSNECSKGDRGWGDSEREEEEEEMETKEVDVERTMFGGREERRNWLICCSCSSLRASSSSIRSCWDRCSSLSARSFWMRSFLSWRSLSVSTISASLLSKSLILSCMAVSRCWVSCCHSSLRATCSLRSRTVSRSEFSRSAALGSAGKNSTGN